MQLTSGDGRILDAKYSVELDGQLLALILESSGGRTEASRRGRNTDYLPALGLLLERLKTRRATLVDALVDSKADNFMGLRILEGAKAEVIIEGLQITTSAGLQADLLRDEKVTRALVNHTQVVPLEAVHTTQTSYQRNAGLVFVRRAEALLVREYVNSLSENQIKRLRTPVGIPDIHIIGPDGTEIVEAKSGSDQQSARDALAQGLVTQLVTQ